MQSNITLKNFIGSCSKILVTFVALCFFTGTLSAQYSNGNLSTGTNSGGTAAPAGYNWSEIQGANVNFGFGGSIAGGLTLADNFVVPAGQTWNVTKFTFYAYSTNYTGATSPFNDLRVQLFNANPSVGTPTPILGNLTTNVLAASPDAFLYRIAAGGAGTLRKIWKMEANLTTSLTAGTYWIEWQNGTIAGVTSNFHPAKTIVGASNQPGDNAQQHTLAPSAWAPVLDGTNPQDFPFDVTYTASGLPCTGTPNPGNTISNIASGCPGAPFSLSLQNATTGLGVTFQWQTSTTLGGTYTNISGATSPTYSGAVSTGAFYHCLVTCGGNVGTSSNIGVALTPPSGCYCLSGATSTADEDIFNVTLGTLNNSSTCASVGPGFGSIQNRYSNYAAGTGAPAAPSITAGQPLPISLSIGTCGGPFTNSVAVWIDWNKNGVFEAVERVYVSTAGTGGPHTETGIVTIPVNATAGVTQMRVVCNETATPNSILPCNFAGYTWGETEDYLVNILPCVPATFTTQPAAASAQCGATATFTTVATGTAASFLWQVKTPAAGSLWTNISNGAIYSGATTSTLSVVVSPAETGNLYRAVLSGPCTVTDFSNAVALTVTPLVAIITPTSASVCLGAIVPITIGNVNAPTTVTFTSTAPSPVPDNVATPTLSNITVSGIPAGAVISNVEVVLNMSHTYPGDMVFNLKGTNPTNITSLYKYAGGNFTGLASGVPAWGWYGARVADGYPTAFSSVATAPFIYNATTNWKPDALNAAVAGAPFSNPTGWVSNSTTIASLIGASPNGTWTMAMCDGGAGDVGTLSSWSIKITYGSASTGVFASVPVTPSTIYTDAAATVAYDGVTPINKVFVKPAANTTYNVAITSGVCNTNASVVVTVNTAPVGSLIVANVNACNGNPAAFSFTGLTSGTGLTYQWQVSTTAVPTFTNITGATSATYTIANATTTLSGNKYRVIVSATGCAAATSLTSTESLLTVNANPIVTISASPITKLFPGLSSTLTAAVSPAPTATTTYQWLRNGVNVAGANANKQVVYIDGLGTYTVIVTDGNGCLSTVTTPASITISDSATNNILFIYPSPNNGKFQVRYYFDNNNVNSSGTYVNVYDEKGGRVFTKPFTPGLGYGQMNVDLGAHGSGVYRVDLLNSRGERLKTGSVMVF